MTLDGQTTRTTKLGAAAWYLKRGLSFVGLELVDDRFLGRTAVFVFRGPDALDLEAVGDESKSIGADDLAALALPMMAALAKVTGRV